MADLTPQREPTNNGRQPDSNHLLKAIQRNAIDDDHISDADLIDHIAGVLDKESTRTLQLHIETCLQCQTEITTMQAVAQDWAKHGPRVSLEDRLRSRRASDTPPQESWWTRIASWISLEPIRPLHGAYAAGHSVAAVDFPVYDGSGITPELHGRLQRRNNEYYIRISIAADEGERFDGRQVEVVLADPQTGQAMLQRKIQLDQLLLLGTDLEITKQQVTARLMP